MGIYDAIGGAPSVQAAVDDFYVRLLADPATSHFFAAADLTRLKSHQRAFMAAALGGPDLYAARDMTAAHRRGRVPRRHGHRGCSRRPGSRPGDCLVPDFRG